MRSIALIARLYVSQHGPMSSSADVAPNGASDGHDHVLRPRPRKPLHSQVKALSRMSSDEVDGVQQLSVPPAENGSTSGMTR